MRREFKWVCGLLLAGGLSVAGARAEVVVYDDDDLVDLSRTVSFVEDPVTVVDGDRVRYFVDNSADVVNIDEVVGNNVRVKYFAPVTHHEVVKVRSFAPAVREVVKVRNFAPTVDVVSGTTDVVIDEPVRYFTAPVSRKVVKVRSFAPAVDVVTSPVIIRKKTTIIER